MKNQPTDLEIYQAQSILALQQAVEKLQNELQTTKEELRKEKNKTTASDPKFDKPIIELYKDFTPEIIHSISN